MPGFERGVAAAFGAGGDIAGRSPRRPRYRDLPEPHRILEVAALVAVAAVALLMARDLRAALAVGWIPLTLAFFVAHPVADLVSGVIHWAADRVLPANARYLGPHFVQPFHLHHSDPGAITHDGFIETNGNTCIVVAPAMAVVWWTAGQGAGSPQAAAWEAFVLGLSFWLCLTNQIHKWAHDPSPPEVVRWLQRHRVILEPGHHALHHAPPFDRCFCITSGWVDPLLDRLGVFRVLERRFRPGRSSVATLPEDFRQRWSSTPLR